MVIKLTSYFTKGIEPLLDNLFSFLRRKTDFFVGASSSTIETTVLNVLRKHADISAKTEKDKKIAKEKEEKLKAARLEKKRKVSLIVIQSFVASTIIYLLKL